jgi:iron complex transport system substrate-binding protein
LTDGAISIYAGSTDTFQNDALNLMKLDNAFKDATGEINLEQLIATNPDVLLVSYYKGGPDVNEMIEQMYQIDSVQSLSAIQNKQIYVIDYNQFWSYSYQIFDGVENLAKEIYPDLVK